VKTVDRGAALLDEREPGWAEKIDLDTLDLSSSCGCVLGQLYLRKHPRIRRKYEAYERKLSELGLDNASGNFGFVTWGGGRFENLTAAWKRAIRARLSR
jgi:hypothetical protein